jgi:hypothetical protein
MSQLRLSFGLVLCAPLLFAAAPAHALTIAYVLSMDGAQVVPGPGDPDGSASGTITLSDSGAVSWDISFLNIASPTAMHIHTGAAGVSGPPFVTLDVSTSGGPGTLISSTSTSAGNAATILADPTGYYVQIHTGEFPGGAVRGQLGTLVPEPGTGGLLGLALAALGAARRRATRRD